MWVKRPRPFCVSHGHEPALVNGRFQVTGQILLGVLDLDGICVSAGSACSSDSLTPSHVLTEMGLTEAQARECLRFSFSWTAHAGDIDTVADAMIHHDTCIRSRRS